MKVRWTARTRADRWLHLFVAQACGLAMARPCSARSRWGRCRGVDRRRRCRRVAGRWRGGRWGRGRGGGRGGGGRWGGWGVGRRPRGGGGGGGAVPGGA